jgi:DNA repair protein RadD
VELRPYQQAAVDAVYDYLRDHDDNPCVVIPTAGGKTPVLSTICKDAVMQWGGRVLVLAHVKELLQQASDKLQAICPELKFGIYSAGLRRRDTEHPVIVAGIQSVYKRACELDAFDLVIVDECLVAGTRIATPAGEVPIEQVQPGMFVRHAMGIGQVLAVSARPVDELVTLEYSDGTAITCTPNHPIFSERGWRDAGSLELGSLAMGVEDMRVLRTSLSTLDEAVSGGPTESPKREVVAQATILLNLLLKNPQQLHAFRRSVPEGERDPQGARTRTEDPWWQRPVDRGPTGLVEAIESRVGCGTRCSCTRSQEQDAAEEPQDRPGQSTANDRYRVGWTQPLFATAEDTRFPQDTFPSPKRLVRVTHYQPASRQVVFNLHVAGHPSYFANGLLVHNCHLIPEDGEGMYRQFLADAKVVNPRVRTIGLTATPFRLKSGMICGPENILNAICFEVGVRELIRDGYLCPLVTKAGRERADTGQLHVRGGEFVADELEQMMDQDQLVEAACQEIIEYTRDRHAVLIFAAGVKHAQHIQRILQETHHVECGFVCGATPDGERDELLGRFRGDQASGLFQHEPLKYLVNVNVLTTGFDAPRIDCVALLRPTLSPGLYYQEVGRGFRLWPGKQNCLVLDFGGNILRHGPVDQVHVKESPSGNGKGAVAPAKECPDCRSVIAAGYAVCPDCGYEFPAPDRAKHDPTASAEGVLSGQVTETAYQVRDVCYCVHTKQGADDDAPKTMRVDYRVGLYQYKSEWVCFEHSGFPRQKAELWWRARSNDPVPATAQQAVDVANAGGLAATKSITVRSVAGEKFDRIVDYQLGEKPEPLPLHQAMGYTDDDIPF